jgi:hypothetical protein
MAAVAVGFEDRSHISLAVDVGGSFGARYPSERGKTEESAQTAIITNPPDNG